MQDCQPPAAKQRYRSETITITSSLPGQEVKNLPSMSLVGLQRCQCRKEIVFRAKYLPANDGTRGLIIYISYFFQPERELLLLFEFTLPTIRAHRFRTFIVYFAFSLKSASRHTSIVSRRTLPRLSARRRQPKEFTIYAGGKRRRRPRTDDIGIADAHDD